MTCCEDSMGNDDKATTFDALFLLQLTAKQYVTLVDFAFIFANIAEKL